MDITRHTVEYSVKQTWSRIGVLAHMYSDIAQQSLETLLHEEANPIPHPGPEVDPELHYAQEDRIFIAAIQTIVFAGMALEAAAYDLAAIQLSDNYAKNLDKLDLVSKWIVIPSLICGKSLNEKGAAINALRTLVPARNALVHHKSSPATLDPAQIEKGRKQSKQLRRDACTAFEAVVLISLELNYVFDTAAGVLPRFEKHPLQDALIPRTYSATLTKFIERCRGIHAHSRANLQQA